MALPHQMRQLKKISPHRITIRMQYLTSILIVLLGVGLAGWWLYLSEPNRSFESPVADAPAASFASVGLYGESINVVLDGELHASLSIDEFQDWATTHWDTIFTEPPSFGEVREVEVANFAWFDESVSLSPDATRVAFSVHDYAVATALTFIGVWHLEDNSIDLVPAANNGNIAELFWSPDSALVAYTLNTARAQGDGVSVDSVDDLKKAVTILTEDLLAALADTEVDVREFLPRLRDLSWDSDTQLRFVSDDPYDAEEELHWLFDVSTSVLEPSS